nr:MAG TPA: hypothetical protein [Caudoviricetes sp.]
MGLIIFSKRKLEVAAGKGYMNLWIIGGIGLKTKSLFLQIIIQV